MNILWHSNAPWTATGYGVQTRLFTPRIAQLGHDVSISAFYGLEGASIKWNGMTVYPKAFHPYGMDVVAQHAKDAGADVVITFVDAWVLDAQRITANGARWAPLFPVDHDPIPQAVLNAVKHAWQPIVYSKHAKEAAAQAGLDALYVPHGVDTNVYAPMPKDEARRKLGFPEDAFIVGIVAANKGVPSRKALPTQLEAFARLRARRKDAMLYLHTHLGPEMDGLDIPSVLQSLGVPEDAVKVCDQYRNIMGYADSVMAGIYSAMDVLSSVTMGEGFGVPIIEAQACGTPVIAGRWTAMPELVGAGWTVSACERILTPMNSYQYLPHADAVLEALEVAYANRNDTALRSTAREFAMQYDADEVTSTYWRPALERMAESLASDDKPLPPVEVVA
jgi:glycosyltransferase involved in cell wall biosynthesis